MIHFSCDLCGTEIDPRNDLRYVVKLEVYAACDESSQTDSGRDTFQELQEILQHVEDAENDQIGDDVYQSQRFDLCPQCRKRFLKNPLGRGNHTLEFSKN